MSLRNPVFAIAILLAILAAAIFNSASQAQTLEEKLIAEDAAKLANEAGDHGNIVRGAILFHQGNINCARCHQPASGMDRLGPDLGSLDAKTTDASIVESILQPSNQISKGFETLVILTSDGRTLNGIKISEDSEQIVIREKDNIDNKVSISRDDIDEVREAKISSMPQGLANELKNRQQFLDLLRYVLDLKERQAKTDIPIASSTVSRKLSESENGLVLIQERNCAACHNTDTLPSPIAAKQAPLLSWSAKKLNPAYIESFIGSPHTTKPGTTMPALLGNLSDEERNKSAKAITHYLVSKAKNQFAASTTDSNPVRQGYEIFHSVGCVACHSPRDKSAKEQWIDGSTPLGNISDKYDSKGLTEFLEDPLSVRKSGHMPNMQLTHREAIELSNFLLQSAPEKRETWKLDPKLTAIGKILFQKLNCTKCHTEFTDSDASATSAPIEKLDTNKGCLSLDKGDWPNFDLSEDDRNSIRACLKQTDFALNDQEKIDVTLASFNCTACHSRNGLGGISAKRNPHFQTTNLNLGDQGRIPPSLSAVGSKLRTEWLRDVMVNGRSIRPYMKTRMPQFGEANIDHLFELFKKNDSLNASKYATFEDQKVMREKGHVLSGSKGLNCVACHTFQYKTSDTMPAVDLTEMAQRLKKDWFYQYMLAPQKFSPNTVMPSFWPSGKAIRNDIEGTPEHQIEAIWQYLLDGRQARAPSGVVREPLEIVVTNEARMLRRQYPGIGKRGVGVGYPGEINIAFDAEQMRLASIWRGKFAEASGVWRGQGSGNVRPMSRPTSFGKGPNIDSSNSPWIVDDGRPPKHQFRGYSLDKMQRPTFFYTFDSVSIDDFTSPFEDENGRTQLRRKITLLSKTQRTGISFRFKTEAKISKSGNSFLIGDSLRIKLAKTIEAQVLSTEGEDQLLIPLEIKPDQPEILLIEYLVK